MFQGHHHAGLISKNSGNTVGPSSGFSTGGTGWALVILSSPVPNTDIEIVTTTPDGVNGTPRTGSETSSVSFSMFALIAY
jgi:hypothetical protein